MKGKVTYVKLCDNCKKPIWHNEKEVQIRKNNKIISRWHYDCYVGLLS